MIAVIGLAIALGALAPAALAAETHRVLIEDMKFVPETLEVAPGDTVVWENKDVVPHTATSEAFDSGLIAAGGTFKLRIRAPGEIRYVCSYHPAMKATLKATVTVSAKVRPPSAAAERGR